MADLSAGPRFMIRYEKMVANIRQLSDRRARFFSFQPIGMV